MQPKSDNVATYRYNQGFTQLATGLTSPDGLAVDNEGNVYLADTHNQRVIKFLKGGGNPIVIGSGYFGPLGVAVDAAGNVYVAANSIYKIPADGSPQVTILTNANAGCIAVDHNSNLYIGSLVQTVYELPAGSSTPIILATQVNPYSVAVDGIGNVYIVDSNFVYEIPFGEKLKIIHSYNGQSPYWVAVDGAENVFWVDGNSGYIYEIPNDGSSAFQLVNSLYAASIAIDQKGNIFGIDLNLQSSPGNATVDEITPTGGYYLSNTLPAGMKFINSSGVIYGKPNAVSPATNYTVTAYNSTGSTAATVSIRTILDAGDNLSSLQLSAGPGSLPLYLPWVPPLIPIPWATR